MTAKKLVLDNMLFTQISKQEEWWNFETNDFNNVNYFHDIIKFLVTDTECDDIVLCGYDEEIGWEDYEQRANKLLTDLGYDLIERQFGGEKYADYQHGIFSLGDKFYKATWSYNSTYGYCPSFDELGDHLVEVFPKVVERVVYE